MASKKLKTLNTLHLDILELLKDAAPGGLTIQEIRAQLGNIEGQQHLDKRVRELRYYHDVPYEGGKYVYKGERSAGAIADSGSISSKLRAQVLELAHGRCQMCGRTVAEDHVKLQIDHKIPRNCQTASKIDPGSACNIDPLTTMS